jgi:hypothetical protein
MKQNLLTPSTAVPAGPVWYEDPWFVPVYAAEPAPMLEAFGGSLAVFEECSVP